MGKVCEMVAGVKAMGLETCMTLGMLTGDQARALKDAGLDYYNHNIDTSPEHYGEIITTRTFQERLDTLEEVREAGISVCCGGIVGMGESRDDRVGFIHALATLPRHPESVPINALVPVKGTVLGDMLRRRADDRRHRVRPHRRGGADHHAAIDGPPVGRPREHVGIDPGALLPRRRQQHLHRRQAAHHRQRRRQRGRCAVRQARAEADGGEEPMRVAAEWLVISLSYRARLRLRAIA